MEVQMDVSTYTKQQGNFLKAEEVNANPDALWEITAEGEIVHSDKFNVDRLHLPLKCGEKEVIFDCSKTNARTIEEELKTPDTKNWVGKHLMLETYKTKTSDGKLVEAINVKSVKL
jgi:hypothetical protein